MSGCGFYGCVPWMPKEHGMQGGGGGNIVQCIEIVKKVVSVMMWNCG